jgi:hypothetical protein
MTDKKVTIENLLTEDNRKHLAELLLNGDVSTMVVIYRKGSSFHCDVTEPAVATILGMLELAKIQVTNDWLHPEEIDRDDGDEEEENENP